MNCTKHGIQMFFFLWKRIDQRPCLKREKIEQEKPRIAARSGFLSRRLEVFSWWPPGRCWNGSVLLCAEVTDSRGKWSRVYESGRRGQDGGDWMVFEGLWKGLENMLQCTNTPSITHLNLIGLSSYYFSYLYKGRRGLSEKKCCSKSKLIKDNVNW